MKAVKLTSKYLFNEIPDVEKKIDTFGHKAYKISLAKKWQFAVPETVFLSGDLVKEIFEKRHIPKEILAHLKNKLIVIRPSPVADQFKKNGPFLYIGLDDQSFDTLRHSVGVKSALEIYFTFLRMFALTVYNLDLENCGELKGLLETLESPELAFVESSLTKISRIKQLISLFLSDSFKYIYFLTCGVSNYIIYYFIYIPVRV